MVLKVLEKSNHKILTASPVYPSESRHVDDGILSSSQILVRKLHGIQCIMDQEVTLRSSSHDLKSFSPLGQVFYGTGTRPMFSIVLKPSPVSAEISALMSLVVVCIVCFLFTK